MSKPYDQLFKSLAEGDPRGLLHLFGTLPLDAPAEIEVIDRELTLPALSVDHVCRIRTPEREWLAHYEAQTHYRSDVPERLLWYATALGMKFRLPVETTLILLAERYAPAALPPAGHVELADLEVFLRYRVMRLWELDPQVVTATGRRHLLPWVTLMAASEETLRSVAAQIADSGDDTLATQFVILGGLRYDREELANMLGRVTTMLLTPEIIEDSSFYQMVLEKGIEKGVEKGIEKGIEQGVEQGRLEEAGRLLHLILTTRFPGLETLLDPGAFTEAARLESLIAEIVAAPNREAVRAAIERFQA